MRSARPGDGGLSRLRPWFGRYTIRYPGTDPVDQYAGLTRAGVERAIVRGGGRVLEEYESMDAILERASGAPGSVRMEEGAARARDHELVATRIGD